MRYISRHLPASRTLATLLLFAVPLTGNAAAFVTGARVVKEDSNASITVMLACQSRFLTVSPSGRSRVFRIELEPTTICIGAPPSVAESQGFYRPAAAEDIGLNNIEFDGSDFGNPVLTLEFNEVVALSVVQVGTASTITIEIDLADLVARDKVQATNQEARATRQVLHHVAQAPKYVINLESSLRKPTVADLPDVVLAADHTLYHTTVEVDGKIWYRTRLGYFSSKSTAAAQLDGVRARYPSAWIDRAEADAPDRAEFLEVPGAEPGPPLAAPVSIVNARPVADKAKLQTLMADAKAAMSLGETSQAVQIYTKVLQYETHEFMPQAQEYLAVAREKNGQVAHAKAEYERYLSLYPDSAATSRVRQRLSALLATSASGQAAVAGSSPRSSGQRARKAASVWRVQAFFSQFYRRDVNQLDENDEVVSQSALFSDMNLDARRRGDRYDFATRLSAGYRYNMLEDVRGGSNDVRISYAYADLNDTRSGLRGRFGRQSRNTGGVLGRFDGFNLGYQLNEKVLLSSVAGKPVNSTSDSLDEHRTFYGLSANIGKIVENLDVGAYYVNQSADGLNDREAVGTELRYFDGNRSLWGLVDYDIEFKTLGSAYLQGSWRFESQFTLNASVNRRRSPFLSTSNALIGQTVTSIDELASLFDADELRQLSLDRAAATTSYTVGASHSLTPNLQVNGNYTQSVIDATPESGGVPATAESTYEYLGLNFVTSSILREGDVAIVGLRRSQSDSSDVSSLNLDIRYPFSRSFYLNPRLRVDYREIHSDASTEWMLSPGLRMQFRWRKSVRIELEAGRRYAVREMIDSEADRRSYFINLGYQAFF